MVTHTVEYIAPLLKLLHCDFPVQYKIYLKIAHIAFTFQYISELLIDSSPVRPFKASDDGTCIRVKSRLVLCALNCFGPVLWNKLPNNLRSLTTVQPHSKANRFFSLRISYSMSVLDCLCMWFISVRWMYSLVSLGGRGLRGNAI